MEAIRKEDSDVTFEREGVGEVRATESGPLTVEFGRLGPGSDGTPLFTGLPDDMCQAHHYGYVISGSMTYKTKQEDIVIRAGEAFHIMPGHIPATVDEACEWVSFTHGGVPAHAGGDSQERRCGCGLSIDLDSSRRCVRLCHASSGGQRRPHVLRGARRGRSDRLHSRDAGLGARLGRRHRHAGAAWAPYRLRPARLHPKRAARALCQHKRLGTSGRCSSAPADAVRLAGNRDRPKLRWGGGSRSGDQVSGARPGSRAA